MVTVGLGPGRCSKAFQLNNENLFSTICLLLQVRGKPQGSAYTWNTPFFDLQFVNIRTKKGKEKFTMSLVNFHPWCATKKMKPHRHLIAWDVLVKVAPMTGTGWIRVSFAIFGYFVVCRENSVLIFLAHICKIRYKKANLKMSSTEVQELPIFQPVPVIGSNLNQNDSRYLTSYHSNFPSTHWAHCSLRCVGFVDDRILWSWSSSHHHHSRRGWHWLWAQL